MIHACIGSTKYILKDEKDAELLLRVCHRAKEIDSHFIGGEFVYSEAKRNTEVEVSILKKEILTQEEIDQLYEEERKKKEAEKGGNQ
ncbi:hypothetical protein [Microbulbifer epialgicus]|uniref:Uncharacterized protein n=1 Tax=Microbulbifer epialgicus TaxID=393907 RepID=A0ABV4NYD6_9GAMM